MPLPPAIDFLSAQTRADGSPLCHFGTSYITVDVPAWQTVRWTVIPVLYLAYGFRVLIDGSVVPGAFVATYTQYGVRPYSARTQVSAAGIALDFFLRVSHAQPLITEISNQTNLTQRWISYDQFLAVATEEDYKELERRLSKHFAPETVGIVTPPVDLSGVQAALDELVRIARVGQMVVPTPEPTPTEIRRWDERRRIIGPYAAER